MLPAESAGSPARRAASTAILGGFASNLVHQWGDPSSKMAGLEGSILGAGNPLLDISAVVEQDLLDKFEVCFADAATHLQVQCSTQLPHIPRMVAR